MTGLNGELSTKPWILTCNQRQRCTCTCVCPMSIDIPALAGLARSNCPDDRQPQGIVRYCEVQRRFPGTCAMGLQSGGFVELVE